MEVAVDQVGEVGVAEVQVDELDASNAPEFVAGADAGFWVCVSQREFLPAQGGPCYRKGPRHKTGAVATRFGMRTVTGERNLTLRLTVARRPHWEIQTYRAIPLSW